MPSPNRTPPLSNQAERGLTLCIIKSIILYQGHLGIRKCKKRACQALFWPFINKELEDMISKCSTTCLMYIEIVNQYKVLQIQF